jgi:hypothetical protein
LSSPDLPSRAKPLADPTLTAALASGLDLPPGPETSLIADHLARVFGRAAVALIHYGSHGRPDDAHPESAQDFFVIVERYGEAYRSFKQADPRTRLPARTAALLNRILPPNVIAVRVPIEGVDRQAKCAVLSLRDLVRGCSRRAPDHFTRGRLFQDVRLLWSRDAAARAEVVEALISARFGTFDWVRPYLPARFDAETYCHVALATSYASEIRPEGTGRAAALVAAQRDFLVPAYSALLRKLAADRVLSPEGDVYRDLRPPGVLRKYLSRLYFSRSRVRSTLRWLKYVALYEGWLDYVLRKVERRSGVTIHLTSWERRWPLIFLWPRALRFLLGRPQRRRH